MTRARRNALAHRLLRLLPLLALLHAPARTHAKFTCATPLAFSEHRLPAILEVENVCPDNPVAMCLEFGGVVYLIQAMPSSTLHTVPTVLDDCWVFRAGTCAGETLLEHAVVGTRKLTIGCTKEATDANSVEISVPTTLDCSLTVTPKLSDVFDASMDYVPPARHNDVSDQVFLDLDQPMQFIPKPDLLRGIYEMCFALSRHGVETDQAFAIFRHARAVIWHTESCHSELVGIAIGFAQAYMGLYGSAFAILHATHDLDGGWIDVPPELTSAQNASLQAKIDYAISINVSTPLPDDALPDEDEGVETDGGGSGRQLSLARMLLHRAVRAVKRSGIAVRAPASPSPTPAFGDGTALCNSKGMGRWKFFKSTKANEPNTTMDCCSPACFPFGAVSRFGVHSFMASCCLSCNMGWCSDAVPPRAKALLQLAEVQLPTNSKVSLKPPMRIMI